MSNMCDHAISKLNFLLSPQNIGNGPIRMVWFAPSFLYFVCCVRDEGENKKHNFECRKIKCRRRKMSIHLKFKTTTTAAWAAMAGSSKKCSPSFSSSVVDSRSRLKIPQRKAAQAHNIYLFGNKKQTDMYYACT